jgi:hypothetical protein
LNRAIAPFFKKELVCAMQNFPYSICVDGSRYSED